MSPCRCGSGKPRFELLDAAGIFAGFVCTDCELAQKRKFRPEVFTHGTQYAMTGDEQDIGLEADNAG